MRFHRVQGNSEGFGNFFRSIPFRNEREDFLLPRRKILFRYAETLPDAVPLFDQAIMGSNPKRRRPAPQPCTSLDHPACSTCYSG